MKHSIALKIFALAVGILTLAVCVTIYTNIEVIGLGKDINVVARTTLPLAKEAAEIDECALERRIAFQTLYGEYMEPNPNQALIEKETKKLEHERQCFHENLEDLRKKLAVLPDDRVQRELYARARELATEMESDFLTETEMAKTILEHRRKGNRDKAHELKVFDDALEDKIDENGKRLQEILMKLAEVSAIRAKQRETRVLWSSITTTLFSIFGGLAVAWFISRNLAQPIGELLKRTRAVESGDLSQKSGDLPEDEIGQLGESFNSMVAELKRKEDLQKAFSTYIDPRIVEKVILPGRPDDMAGQKRVMTVLFTDLVGFTTLGENLTASGLVKVINRYFTLMSQCVQIEKGIIDKFIGDAVMAYWGPPFVAEEEQAAAACRSALRQLDALALFRKELPEVMGMRKNLPEINLRIGLASGEVVVGNIGSESARNYTVMGDVVNLASRMEGANNFYGTRILISEETLRLAGNAVEVREIDAIAVKGKSDPVHVFEVLSLQGQLPPDWEERKSRFAEGLEAYRKQNWSPAQMIFRELVEKYADGPSKTFLERVLLLEKQPPGAGWDGVWRLTSK